MKISDYIDVDSLDNVFEEVKPIFKKLLYYLDLEYENTNSFTEEQINRMISDINTGMLSISIADEKNIDEYLSGNPYLAGYYRNTVEGKKIVIKADDNEQNLLLSLSHEWEHFLTDEIASEEIDEYKKTQNNLKKKLKEDKENVIYNSEFSELKSQNPRGAFSGDYTNSDWIELWDEAATELIASDRVNIKPSGYSEYTKFLQSILILNGKSISDLKAAYRKGDLSFIYSLMPKDKLLNISKLELQLHNSVVTNDLIGVNSNKYSAAILNVEIGEYLNEVANSEKYKNLSEEDKVKVFSGIFELNKTYDKKMRKYNKLEMQIMKMLTQEKENCNNSQELILKLNNWYEKNEISNSERDISRIQLIYLRSILYSKKIFNEDTSSIDDVCGEFENRLVHKEKLQYYNDGMLENNENNPIKAEYTDFNKIEKHFIYINGKRYLNLPFKENDMSVRMYGLDADNLTAKLIKENGIDSDITERKFENTDEFISTANNIIEKLNVNKEVLSKFNDGNEAKLRELFSKQIEYFIETQSPKENGFISDLKNATVKNVRFDSALKESDKYKNKEEGVKNGR